MTVLLARVACHPTSSRWVHGCLHARRSGTARFAVLKRRGAMGSRWAATPSHRAATPSHRAATPSHRAAVPSPPTLRLGLLDLLQRLSFGYAMPSDRPNRTRPSARLRG